LRKTGEIMAEEYEGDNKNRAHTGALNDIEKIANARIAPHALIETKKMRK